jgi:hypothetical protein
VDSVRGVFLVDFYGFKALVCWVPLEVEYLAVSISAEANLVVGDIDQNFCDLFGSEFGFLVFFFFDLFSDIFIT